MSICVSRTATMRASGSKQKRGHVFLDGTNKCVHCGHVTKHGKNWRITITKRGHLLAGGVK